MRIALYARVSTEEQAKHGYSIDAQLASLRQWAADNHHVVVDEYIDEGVSARKMPSKRPQLQRLCNDLAERGIALIAFTKLDRWTRNVKGYYQVQDILDRNGVAWIAIQEDYETLTASGRFKVNIMLSVAENEADRTSERIKTVFAYKREQGQYTGGHPLFGFRNVNKKLVPDPDTAPIAQAMFQHYLDTASYYDTARYLHQMTGRMWQYNFIRKCLSNPLYIGEYHGIKNYCEPIVEEGVFRRAQELMKSRSVRHNPNGRTYIFAGLVRCSCCGKAMSGFTLPKPNGEDYYYRCSEAMIYHRCEHRHSIREERLERWMVDNAAAELDKWSVNYSVKQKKPADSSRIKRKLDRLKDLFLDELISLDEYKTERAQLEAQIVPKEETDYSDTIALFQGDFRAVYANLTREERKRFWQATINTIELDADNNPRILFR